MDKDMNVGLEFERFVLSVIQQKCISQNKPFFSEFTIADFLQNYKDQDSGLRNKLAHGLYCFVRYAPQGFDNFTKPVIIEVKYHVRKMNFSSLIEDDENYISLYITNSHLSDNDKKNRILGKNVFVWDQKIINSWA